MPWHVAKSARCPASKPWAVIKNQDKSVAGCHSTKEAAQKQMAALYANEPAGGTNSMGDVHSHAVEECADCGERHESGERAVDNGAWDGSAAMSKCAKSSTPASCYASICAGRKSGPSDQQSSWALPHHATSGGPPNAAGVRNALSRLPQTQGLTNRSEAESHLQAHLKAIQGSQSNSADVLGLAARKNGRPPREGIVRGVFPLEFRDDGAAGDGMPTMFGHFAVFNRWTEIDSFWEGRFLESIAPGAFAKTFSENRDAIRCLFQHGKDPAIGSKILGPVAELREDDTGAYYEVPLYDTSYNRDLLPGLRDGQYGASFRFRVTQEQLNNKPERSDYNPEGIPERQVKELELAEFGPVTFPAYSQATASVRSLTDDFILTMLGAEPGQLQRFLAEYVSNQAGAALHRHGAEEPHSDAGAADDRPKVTLTVFRNPNRH